MSKLNRHVINNFLKTNSPKEQKNKSKFVRGIVVKKDRNYYVRLNGANSDELMPISAGNNISVNEQVTVLIENHTATVISNTYSTPSSDSGDILNPTADTSPIPISDIESLWDSEK